MRHPASNVSSFRNTCFKCNAAWGGCHCADVPEDKGFEFDGVNIINPVVSECGRFFVDPVIHYGEAYLKWNNTISVREQILSEMSDPEVFNGMTDIEMLNHLDAEVYASHGDEYVVDWRNRFKTYMEGL